MTAFPRTFRPPPLHAFILLLALAGCGEAGPFPAERAGDPPAATVPTPGRLVIVGGALDRENEAIYRAILAGREGEGALCVIPTAGADPEASMASAVERFDRWGGEGTARGVLLPADAPELAADPGVAGSLRECSGFFFTGGVQSRILRVFRPGGASTPAYEVLMERWRAGAVVAGSSAGAAMMSHPMIAGGGSEGAFREGVTWTGSGDGVELEPGMGFLPGLPVDQHFLARGRIGRLLTVVLLEEDVAFAAGVDEDTALVVEDGWGWVVGASGVVWVDGTRAQRGSGGSPVASSGLRIHLLGDGDRVELEGGTVIRGEGKEGVTVAPQGGEGGDPAEGTLFDPWVLLHVLHGMAGDGPGDWTGRVAGHEITLVPGEGFQGVAWPREGIRGTPRGLSVGPLEVRIRER